MSPDPDVSRITDLSAELAACRRRADGLAERLASLREALNDERRAFSAQVASLRGENARLRAQLDAEHPERLVLLVPDAGLDAAMAASAGERPGTLLRATGTGREWELAPGGDGWRRVT